MSQRTSQKDDQTKDKNPSWGRLGTATLIDTVGALLPLVLCPFLPIVFHTAIEEYNGSLWVALIALVSNPHQFACQAAGLLTKQLGLGIAIFLCWYTAQAVLAVTFPGKIGHGQLTPAGHVLEYKINGLSVWALTHLLFILAVKLGWLPAAIIIDLWGPILFAQNIMGYALTLFAYVKGHFFPTHAGDVKLSGSFLYDLLMGVEFNPRIGRWFDFKLFHNGRPGIILWTLINLSCAAAQQRAFGHVTNAMILNNILEAIYVVDFFANEDWYLRTIDICHDHFGFYLAWGDLVWLPTMYTLQARWLAHHDYTMSWPFFWLTLAMGLTGYAIFRGANRQKDRFRAAKGNITIWGKPARFLEAPFTTSDGQRHVSQLLHSGFWGLARHFNYVGDLLMSLSFCLCTGLGGLADGLPYFYIVYMTILLVHRIHRDQLRLKAKYGAVWDKYCRIVPAKLIPGIW